MAGIDLATAEARLAAYLTSELDILTRLQSVGVDGDTLMRAQLVSVQRGIEIWDIRCKRLGGSRAGVQRKVMVDTP